MSYLHFYPASLADVLDCFSVSIPAIETTPLMDRLPLESGLLPANSCAAILSPLATRHSPLATRHSPLWFLAIFPSIGFPVQKPIHVLNAGGFFYGLFWPAPEITSL